MVEHRTRAVQMFSQEEIFRVIAYGALKARAAARLAPGEIMLIGEFELTVAEDENGDGIVVQIIETVVDMELLALGKMRLQDTIGESWSEHERRAWMAAFWKDLAQYLDKWQNIKMRLGPGEHITFEKAVSK